jgi:hypothetical protein
MTVAPSNVDLILTNLQEIMKEAAAYEACLSSPAEPDWKFGWTLHGAVSHLAIRATLTATPNPTL